MDVNDLPVEVLSQIFLNLADNSDRMSVRDVCCLWRGVIDTTVGVQKWVGQGGNLYEPVAVLGTIGISDCTFSNVSPASRSGWDIFEVKHDYLLPHLMRRVAFDGLISREMFTHLTNPLRNLTSLTIHISSLAAVEMNLQNTSLSHSLTSLSLTNAGDEESLMDVMQYGIEGTVSKNFSSICDTDFPKLRRLDVTLPYMLYEYSNFDVFSHLKNFLWNRRPKNLETLNLLLHDKWLIGDELQDVFRAGLGRKEMQCLEKWNAGQELVDFVIQDLDMICVAAFPMSDRIMSREELETITCTHLYWYNNRLIPMMQGSWATLTEVRLTIKLMTGNSPVDCSVFFDCTVLKILVVEKTEGRSDEIVIGDPTVQNISSLPLSLKTLEFRNILMDIPSVEHVSKSLQLETLVLDGIGSKDNLGMSIPTLLWILKESPTITALKVEGLNDFCRSSSLAFTLLGLIWPPICQTCKVPHQTVFWKTSSGANGIVGKKDKELLNSIFAKTNNRDGKSVPFIKKRNGVWDKTDESY